MLEGLPADIAIFDKDHRYVYLNKTAIKDKFVLLAFHISSVKL